MRYADLKTDPRVLMAKMMLSVFLNNQINPFIQ